MIKVNVSEYDAELNGEGELEGKGVLEGGLVINRFTTQSNADPDPDPNP